jgi:hypothetical protein
MSSWHEIDAALGEIPPDHPWYRAVVALVDELKHESYIGVLAPPGQATSNDSRNYDSGRVAMAEDILTRLRGRYSALQPER